MSSARKTLKILALVYFVLGIASLVIAGVGIATGNLDSTYGSNAMLAAVVLVAKGLIDLAAGVAGIKGANKPSQVDGAFKLGIVAAIATIAQAALTLPALGGSSVNIGRRGGFVKPFVSTRVAGGLKLAAARPAD